MEPTEQEFNLAMAELEGHTVVDTVNGHELMYPFGDNYKMPDYYNDLNQLMPIAWKHNIFQLEKSLMHKGHKYSKQAMNLSMSYAPHRSDEERKQAIREYLWAIYLEGKSDE